MGRLQPKLGRWCDRVCATASSALACPRGDDGALRRASCLTPLRCAPTAGYLPPSSSSFGPPMRAARSLGKRPRGHDALGRRRVRRAARGGGGEGGVAPIAVRERRVAPRSVGPAIGVLTRPSTFFLRRSPPPAFPIRLETLAPLVRRLLRRVAVSNFKLSGSVVARVVVNMCGRATQDRTPSPSEIRWPGLRARDSAPVRPRPTEAFCTSLRRGVRLQRLAPSFSEVVCPVVWVATLPRAMHEQQKGRLGSATRRAQR